MDVAALRVDLADTPAKSWRNRLGALLLHDATEDDPRVRQARAGLAYHRMEGIVSEFVELGWLERGFAGWFLEQLRYFPAESSPDSANNGHAAVRGKLDAPPSRQSQESGQTGDPTVSRPAQTGVSPCTVQAPAPAEEAVAP